MRYSAERPKPPVDLPEDLLRWADIVARGVARGLPPSFDLDDLKQVARVETWRKIQVFDKSRGVSFTSFAYRAVKGACLMYCRRRHYREATHAELPSEDRGQAQLDPTEERIQFQRIRQLLGICIAELADERQRHVIDRYFRCGWDTGTIAEELNCSESLIRSIRQQAYAALRVRLEARGISSLDIPWQ